MPDYWIRKRAKVKANFRCVVSDGELEEQEMESHSDYPEEESDFQVMKGENSNIRTFNDGNIARKTLELLMQGFLNPKEVEVMEEGNIVHLYDSYIGDSK